MKAIPVAALEKLIQEDEEWASEYIKREARSRAKRALREAAHFEDLIAVHQCRAQELRRIIEAANRH